MVSKLLIVALSLFVAGPLGARVGLLPAMVGFGLFALGGILGIVTALWGVISGLRGRGWAPGVAGVALAGTFLAIAAPSAKYPPYNDFTTDTDDPPSFVGAGGLPANEGRDLSYPAGAVLEAQLEAYADLQPLDLDVPPAAAFNRVRNAAARMPNWVVLVDDPGAGVLEGVATSRLFRFRDDFVIRVRARGVGSRVDMRSKSRDGRGDLGANATRIRQFFALLASSP